MNFRSIWKTVFLEYLEFYDYRTSSTYEYYFLWKYSYYSTAPPLCLQHTFGTLYGILAYTFPQIKQGHLNEVAPWISDFTFKPVISFVAQRQKLLWRQRSSAYNNSQGLLLLDSSLIAWRTSMKRQWTELWWLFTCTQDSSLYSWLIELPTS